MATPEKKFDNVTIQVTQYDPTTGEIIRQLSAIDFGKIQRNSFGDPIVIKMNVAGVKQIGNIKLGLVRYSVPILSSGLTNSDGSRTSGNFGIEHSKDLVIKKTLSSFFSGLNLDQTDFNENNVSIPNSTFTESEFIYLSPSSPETIGPNNLKLKWFFNFS